MFKTVLILGGTTEARTLADRLVDEDLRVITSLAGRTRSPKALRGSVRVGGFGGAKGLAAYMTHERVDLLIDATHPYAAQISAHAVDASHKSGCPLLRIERPDWQPVAGDRWVHVTDAAAAARVIVDHGRTCLITTGVNELAKYEQVRDVKLFVRLLEKPKDALPHPDMEIIIGRPPYALDDEKTLFALLGIDVLVTKNAGGDATRAKIDAARDLGLPVIMIDRPEIPVAEICSSVDDAIRWVKARSARDD